MTAHNERILLGLGASRRGNWGTPAEALKRCIELLGNAGFDVECASSLYETAGIGPGRAGVYVNAVVRGDSHLAPVALLRSLKGLEALAGRRSAMRWGPRPLDIDILAWRGILVADRLLTVPHPQMHNRPFVLAPLAEIAPGWRHPVLGLTARELLKRLPPQSGGKILRKLKATC